VRLLGGGRPRDQGVDRGEPTLVVLGTVRITGHSFSPRENQTSRLTTGSGGGVVDSAPVEERR